jgi:3-isopropylmalate/(R)-2-methylmalate dehydratase small subunit
VRAFKTLESGAAPFFQPNVDTDQIIPARFLPKPRSGGFGQYLFHDLRFDKNGAERPEFVLNKPSCRDARIVVGNVNFGCGSSRENAVWALHDYGVEVVIAPSFGDIFYSNCIKNGLLPVCLPEAVVTDLLARISETPDLAIQVDLEEQTVTLPDGSKYVFEIDPFAKYCLINGLDELDYTLSHRDEIDAFENRYGREND